jgi:hypothetical protein
MVDATSRVFEEQSIRSIYSFRRFKPLLARNRYNVRHNRARCQTKILRRGMPRLNFVE